MENDEFHGEINDKDLVLERVKFSTLPLCTSLKINKMILKITKDLLKLTAGQSHGMFLTFVIKKFY